MGFLGVRRRAIACLQSERFDSVARGEVAHNNLLATGEVSVDDVVRMIRLCRGTQYRAAPMTENPSTMKHVHLEKHALSAAVRILVSRAMFVSGEISEVNESILDESTRFCFA